MKVYSFLILVFVLFTSCKQQKNVYEEGGRVVEIKYATGFSITEYENYKLLRIHNPWQNAEDISYEYIIANKGVVLTKEILQNRQVIYTPVERIVCMSTTHIGLISLLEEEESIVGTSGLNYISNEFVVERAEKGLIKEIGYEQNINYEVLVSLNPDLVITYGIGSEISGIVNKLRELNLPVVLNADYLEVLPLGKAEWIKFISLFYKKDSIGLSRFKEIESNYLGLQKLVENVDVKLKVLTGLSWKGTWYVPGGNSFFANFIKDAGGEYIWKNNSNNESLPFSIEAIFENASDADVWLHIGNVHNKADIIKTDSRLAELEVFKKGKLYNNNFKMNVNGGNDYWESGIAHPDDILKDLICIFHPGLLQDWELKYYKKIE